MEVDGQCKCGFEGEQTVGKETQTGLCGGQQHRSHIVVEEVETLNNKPFPMTLMSSVPSLQHTFSCQSIWKK